MKIKSRLSLILCVKHKKIVISSFASYILQTYVRRCTSTAGRC